MFIFSPCVGYIMAVVEMVNTRSAEGFSPYVSLILIMSSLIRLFWWFSERFSDVLLATAVVAVVMQLILTFFWVKIMTNDGKKPLKEEAFWFWNQFSTYLSCLGAIAATLAFTTYIAGDNKLYSDVLGTASAVIEAMLPVPQLLLIHKNKHTAGVSMVMITLWLSGDGFKLYYYAINNSPI